MVEFGKIGRYKENNRIEAKKALGGLPESIWETYSAFANTVGGIILLGVEEYKDKSLHVIDLPEPEKLVAEFWKIINNRGKVSANILTEKNVRIITTGGKRIIAIEVPRADMRHRPVYIGADPFGGSYRRSGEGDFRCTVDEVSAMLRERNACGGESE
jgi:predicted HTH transcriptional regulator